MNRYILKLLREQRVYLLRLVALVALLATSASSSVSSVVAAPSTRSARSVVRGGVLVELDASTKAETNDTTSEAIEALESLDSLQLSDVTNMLDTLSVSDISDVFDVSVKPSDLENLDPSSVATAADSLALTELLLSDTLSRTPARRAVPMRGNERGAAMGERASEVSISDTTKHKKFISDSMSLSKMCWISTVLPGFGQAYNKQYWKMPILYGALATGIALYVDESKRYKPLKAEYDEIVMASATRTEYLNSLQGQMIRSNTRRQAYLGATIASYIYFLGDAAVHYATNEESDVKRATTLSTICPGAGQIYNKSYWKVPFVVGGFASMIYVIDWNNRGYKRFKKAYIQLSDYNDNPDDYPDGSPDEFSGRYSESYLQSLRNSYRRNRDLSIIMLAGLYVLQIIDAHVDAHLKDFDISDDLTMEIEPMMNYSYLPSVQKDSAVFGFNVGIKF